MHLASWLSYSNVPLQIDRSKTPWVIAFFHNPWYTTFSGFKTDDCTRQALEPLLKMANVDLVYNGARCTANFYEDFI